MNKNPQKLVDARPADTYMYIQVVARLLLDDDDAAPFCDVLIALAFGCPPLLVMLAGTLLVGDGKVPIPLTSIIVEETIYVSLCVVRAAFVRRVIPPRSIASLLRPRGDVVSVSTAVSVTGAATLGKPREAVVMVVSGSAEVSGRVMAERETVRVLSMTRAEEAMEMVTPAVVMISPGCNVTPPRIFPACVGLVTSDKGPTWVPSTARAEGAMEMISPAVVRGWSTCEVVPPRTSASVLFPLPIGL